MRPQRFTKAKLKETIKVHNIARKTMGLRETFLNAIGGANKNTIKQDNSAIRSARDFLINGNRGDRLYPTWSDIKMPDSDMYSGYSYAVIQKRGNKVASLAKENLRTLANQEIVDEYQKKEENVLHPYLKLIEDSADFTEKQFWKNISIYLDLAGRYYLGIIRGVIKPTNPKLPIITTDATKLIMLNPYEIRRVVDKNKNVAGYIERKKDGRYREWPVHQIIEMRELDPFDPENGHWAMTDAAKDAVYTINQSGDYTRQSLNGNIDAPGIITTDVLLNDNDFANFRARVTQHTKGEPLFGNGTGAIKWDSMQIDLDKAALMDINEINRTTLFAVSGTSKTSLGIEQSGTTRETARVQSEQFISDTAQPRLEDIVDFLNLDYKKNYPREYKQTGYKIQVQSAVGRDYDTDQKAVALKQSQFQLAMTLVQSGYTEESAWQFAEGEIEHQDLELEKGLDKPKMGDEGNEAEGSNENSPNSPNNGPQSGSGSGNGSNTTSENNSLETTDNDAQDKDVLTTDLNELEPHSDLVENGGKGNPNHDPKTGQFTTGSGGSSIKAGKVSHKSYSSDGKNVVAEWDEVEHPVYPDDTIIMSKDQIGMVGNVGSEYGTSKKAYDVRDKRLKNPFDVYEPIDKTEETLVRDYIKKSFGIDDSELDEKLEKTKNSVEGKKSDPLEVLGVENGGKGSGNFGHQGRPGLIGGSSKTGYSGISFSEGAKSYFEKHPERKKEFDDVIKEYKKIGLKRGFHFTTNAYDVAAEGEGFFDVGKYSGRTVTNTAEGGSTVYVSPTLFEKGMGEKFSFEKNGRVAEVDTTFVGVLRHELGHLYMTQLFLEEARPKGDLNQSVFDRYNSEMLSNSGCKRPFLGGKWSMYADINSGEAIAEAFSNPDYSEDTRKTYDYVSKYKIPEHSRWTYRGNSAQEDVIIACVGYPIDDKVLKEFLDKKNKNHCTCEHDHKVETLVNELQDDHGKVVKDAYDEFLSEIREIEKETINACVRKVNVNAFEEDDIIGKRKKESLIEKLKNALHKYWWVVFPTLAKNSMSRRNKEFSKNIDFVFNNDLKASVDDNAKRVSEGHMETILGDVLEASNKAYAEVLEDAAAELIIKVYDDSPTKWEKYFEHKPTKAEALDSIRRTDILEENRRIYERANTMAFEGYNRRDIIKAIRNEYKDISEKRATLIARNETARAFGKSQFEADRQFLNGVGKLDQAYKIWYSRRPATEQDKICSFCRHLIETSNANPIPFEEPFVEYGNSLEVIEDGKVKIFTANYEDIQGSTLHPNCSCGYKLVFKNSAGEFVKTLNGGKGSGNFGHEGRPGEVGGSGKGSSVREQFNKLKEITNWTDSELQYVIPYFGSFENTSKVQEYLRGGDESYLTPTVSVVDCVNYMKRKMAQTTFPEDTTLYRGMMIRNDRMERVEKNGFSYPGFQSTTLMENDASRIIQEYRDSGNYDKQFYTPVLLKINAKKGGHFASSYTDGEHEIVLPDNIEFKIKNKKPTSWGAVIYEVDYE